MPYITPEDADEPIKFSFSDLQFGEDEEIDPEELPYGLVTQDTLNDAISTRLSRQERKLKDELKSDDEFFQTAAEARGIELREDGKPKGHVKDEEWDQLKKEASRAKSLAEKVETYESQIESTRNTQLENEVLKHADGIAEGAQDDVLNNVRGQMTYDDEYGWVKTDEDGEVAYDNAEPVRAQDVVSQVREQKPFLFKDRSAGAGPEDKPNTSSSGGKKTWTDAEHANADPTSMDDSTYKDWMSAAEEGRIQ